MSFWASLDRIRQWAQPDGDNDKLEDVRADLRAVLDGLDYYACKKAGVMGSTREDASKIEGLVWYKRDGWDHGGHAISWKERAQELEQQEARLYWITHQLAGSKWRDAGPLGWLQPEDEKYIREDVLLAAIDREIEKEKGDA